MIISIKKHKHFWKEKLRFSYSPGYNYCNLFQAYEFLFPNIHAQDILFAQFTMIMIFSLGDPHDFCYSEDEWIDGRMNDYIPVWNCVRSGLNSVRQHWQWIGECWMFFFAVINETLSSCDPVIPLPGRK